MSDERFICTSVSVHLYNDPSAATNKAMATIEKNLFISFFQGQTFVVLSHIMKETSPSYQVVPSDGMGGAAGHGLFATCKGVLWSCRSLVVSTARIHYFCCVYIFYTLMLIFVYVFFHKICYDQESDPSAYVWEVKSL